MTELSGTQIEVLKAARASLLHRDPMPSYLTWRVWTANGRAVTQTARSLLRGGLIEAVPTPGGGAAAELTAAGRDALTEAGEPQ
jgi:hypothetical protein